MNVAKLKKILREFKINSEWNCSHLSNKVAIRHAAAGAGCRFWLDPALIHSEYCGRGSASVFVSFFIQFSTISAVLANGLLIVRDFLSRLRHLPPFYPASPKLPFFLGVLQRRKLITTPREFLCVIYVHLHFYVANRESVPGLPFHPSVWSGPPSLQVSSVARRWFSFKLFRFRYLYQSKV